MKHWDQTKCTFCDVEATLRAHDISKTTAQNKKAIEGEVNILLLGSSNKRRTIGEHKALRDIRLGEQEDANNSEDP